MQRQDLLFRIVRHQHSLTRQEACENAEFVMLSRKIHLRKITSIVQRDFRGALQSDCGNRNYPRDFRGAVKPMQRDFGGASTGL